MRRALLFTLCLLVSNSVMAGDSPQFRGPGGEGHSDEKHLPLTWSPTENIRWKTDLEGLGWSTPSIVGSEVWLTTALDEGKSLRVICLDKDSGAIRHNVEVFHHDDPGPIHKKNSYASPSVLIDGDRLYVHFGRLGTACLDHEAKVLWKTELKYNHRHGPGGSPVIFGDLLVIACDGTDIQYVTALNKRTGKEEWKTTRDGKMAYSTPLVIEVNGQKQLVSTGGEWAISYAPETGQELWRFRYPAGYSNVPRPPLNPSPLLIGSELYLVDDSGIAACLDAKTGKQHWKRRIGGNFTASPLYAEERIYLLDEAGKTYVIAPTKEEYRELAVNELPGRTQASIAAADESLFLRTDTSLYRIQSKR